MPVVPGETGTLFLLAENPSQQKIVPDTGDGINTPRFDFNATGRVLVPQRVQLTHADTTKPSRDVV